MDIIQIIKGSCKTHIFRYYSPEKQTNINELQGYTQEDKDQMWAFINACRARSNELEQLENPSISDIDYSDIVP